MPAPKEEENSVKKVVGEKMAEDFSRKSGFGNGVVREKEDTEMINASNG